MVCSPGTVPLILCFGDSLTAGYQSPAIGCPEIRETPYGSFLQALTGPRARIAVSGVCGELTAEMVLRFHRDVVAPAPGFVVILGGTNDLGWDRGPVEIMRNLLTMYEMALGAGIQPVAVTVPSIRVDLPRGGGEEEGRRWVTDHIERRAQLNRLIDDYGAKQGVAVVDLFAATAEPDTRMLAAAFSNDGLHLTTKGYRLLARLLYDQVFAPKLGQAEAPRR